MSQAKGLKVRPLRAAASHVGPWSSEKHPHGGGWLREIVFGLNDGLVTTLIFIIAVSAVKPAQLVLVALGEMLAGGVSMGLGGYLSARTEQDILEQRIATERHEIVHEPEEERAELRAIYHAKGLRGPLLDTVVTYLTSNEERWLRTMVSDELGVVHGEASRAPWKQGLMVGISFVAGALVPVVPFALHLPLPQLWAYALTAATALGLGAVKARYTLKSALRNGMELLGVVTAGTLAGLVIGVLLHAA